jgi:ribosomal-protein-alanine N-acetyltransferase
MSETVSIRPAGPGDAAVLARLHAGSFADAWSEVSIARLAGGPGAYALIASHAGEDGGFALLHCVPPEAELLSIGVQTNLRRSGIARALLQHAARDLSARGVTTMFLDVAADNSPAMALYRSLGFSDISRRARYYRGEVDAIMMQAEIGGIAG